MDCSEVLRKAVIIALSRTKIHSFRTLISLITQKPRIKSNLPCIAMISRNGTLYIRSDITKYSPEFIAAVIMHEALHLVLQHLERIGQRNERLWNIAADMEINDDLSVIFNDIDWTKGILPSRYGFDNGLTAEQYYDLLCERKNDDNDDCDNDDEDDTSDNGENNNTDNTEYDYDDDNDNFFSSGSASDGIERPWETDEVDAEQQERIREVIEQTRQQINNEPKNIVKSISDSSGANVLSDRRNRDTKCVNISKLRSILQKYLNVYDLNFNVKFKHRHNLILPKVKPRYEATEAVGVVAIDCSGSMSTRDIDIAANIALTISQTLGLVHIIAFNSSVVLHRIFNKQQKSQIKQLLDSLVAEGGTSIPDALKYIYENIHFNKRFPVFVVSDMESSFILDKPIDKVFDIYLIPTSKHCKIPQTTYKTTVLNL